MKEVAMTRAKFNTFRFYWENKLETEREKKIEKRKRKKKKEKRKKKKEKRKNIISIIWCRVKMLN